MEVTNTGAKSLTTSAFQNIKTDILMGRLKPLQRLRVQGLSERYGIGATGIREALSRLVTDGLVEVEDQRGFCVAAVSREELLDLTATRISVEQLGLVHAVQKGDLDWETNLLSTFHRLSRTPLPDSPDRHVAWAIAHRQFHEALLRGCGSPWFMHLGRLLYDQSERYRNLAENHTQPGSRDALDEHQQLLDAAMARDAGKLCELIETHFLLTTNIILQVEFGQPEEAGDAKRTRQAQ